MINQKLFTIIGAGSRTVVRAALNSELYPVNGGDYEVQFSGVSILSGKLFGAYNVEEGVTLGQPQILAGTLRVYQNYVENFSETFTLGQPQILAATLKSIVVNETVNELPLVYSGVSIISGNLKDIVVRFEDDTNSIVYSGTTIISGSLG
jgi:hypothetical protein